MLLRLDGRLNNENDLIVVRQERTVLKDWESHKLATYQNVSFDDFTKERFYVIKKDELKRNWYISKKFNLTEAEVESLVEKIKGYEIHVLRLK